jgi:hypothetical protein
VRREERDRRGKVLDVKRGAVHAVVEYIYNSLDN